MCVCVRLLLCRTSTESVPARQTTKSAAAAETVTSGAIR